MGASSLSPVYVALIHYPVYNKNREVIRTCLTPLDLHDIARAGRTYGVREFFCVNSLASQMELAQMIKDHWTEGWGARYNPNRKEALSLARIYPDLDSVLNAVEKEEGRRPITVATGARIEEPDLDYPELRSRIEKNVDAFVILFGTGWGLTEPTPQATRFAPGTRSTCYSRWATGKMPRRRAHEPS